MLTPMSSLLGCLTFNEPKYPVWVVTCDLLFQAQNRGTDVGRSPALEKRVNLRSRDRSPAPGGRAGMVNGAFVSTY